MGAVTLLVAHLAAYLLQDDAPVSPSHVKLDRRAMHLINWEPYDKMHLIRYVKGCQIFSFSYEL